MSRHLSPTALNHFLGCEHRTYLDILDRRGELDAERRPPKMQLLSDCGKRHEQAVADQFGDAVVSLEMPDASVAQRAGATLAAMREGREVLHQACLADDGWIGYPDFLVRVEQPSALGTWSYEAHDAKLGSHPRPNHIFQLLFYTDELERLQGRRPARMHLMLGDGSHPSFDPDEFTAYAAPAAGRRRRRKAPQRRCRTSRVASDDAARARAGARRSPGGAQRAPGHLRRPVKRRP